MVQLDSPLDPPVPLDDVVLLAMHRKLARKVESGRGMHFSADEVRALVAIGAFATVAVAATECQVRKCQERSARSRSINAALMPSTPEPIGKISRLSGMMPSDAANEALAQARAICGRRS